MCEITPFSVVITRAFALQIMLYTFIFNIFIETFTFFDSTFLFYISPNYIQDVLSKHDDLGCIKVSPVYHIQPLIFKDWIL